MFGLTRKDLGFVAGGTVVVLMASLAGDALGLAALAAWLGFLSLFCYRRILERITTSQLELYRQVDPLISLHQSLQLQAPLPTMREWAQSPDHGLKLLEIIRKRQPKFVLEAGSGVSTIIIARCLQQLGQGRVISLEHDPDFAAQTRSWLEWHGLTDVAEVVVAPLAEQAAPGGTDQLRWYDLANFSWPDETVDLIHVDGPPNRGAAPDRYPILAAVGDRLASDALLIADDAHRPQELRCASWWQRDFPDFRQRSLNTEKGTLILER